MNVLGEGADDWQGNRVVGAQADRTQALVEQFADSCFNRREGLLERELQIARIAVRAFGAQIDAGFRPWVRGIGTECHADDRQRSFRSTQPSGVGVEGNTEDNWSSGV